MEELILEKLGFTPGEIKVYITLMRLGNVTTGPIVDESGISKSKVYEILERLSKKGIVSQIIQDSIKHFQAVHPKRLLELYEEKESDLKQLKNSLINIMPGLESHYNNIEEKQEINIYKGYNGIKSVFNDILDNIDENNEYIVFCVVEVEAKFQPFLDEFTKKRIKKKAKQKIIFNENVSQRQIEINHSKNKLTEVKIISSSFNTPAVFNLYKNKTAILVWSKKPIAIVIENSEVTNSFRQYFEVIWNIAK